MPDLGDGVSEGILARWHKKPGDAVQPGETLFEVETDKVSREVESPGGGVLAEILVPEGELAKTGDRLAVIR